MGCRQSQGVDPKLTILVILFLCCFFVVSTIIINSAHSPELSEEINGEYNSFKLGVYDRNTVSVTVLAEEPRAYIAALSDALEMTEQMSGRKVVKVYTAGVPAVTHFYLQQQAEKE